VRRGAAPGSNWGRPGAAPSSYRGAMSARASASPTSSRVEVVLGGAMAFAGALVLVTRIGSLPGFLTELLVGFVSVADFWPMLGGTVLLALGVLALVRGRRGIRRHRRAVERLELMRLRQQQRQPGGSGVSAGVGGTPHRVHTSR
jgi:hypothetical protein